MKRVLITNIQNQINEKLQYHVRENLKRNKILEKRDLISRLKLRE